MTQSVASESLREGAPHSLLDSDVASRGLPEGSRENQGILKGTQRIFWDGMLVYDLPQKADEVRTFSVESLSEGFRMSR